MSTTALTIGDVLLKDPTRPIPNEGVSKVVGRPRDPMQWDVLRFELDNFVSEGAYEEGLERILSRFLTNQGKGDQPGAWVSGFFGSGKSHFTRVLDALWTDLELPDGSRARGLVHKLSDDIKADLTELSTRGKQGGGLWAASGTLSSGAQSFRMAVLDILLQAADLPAKYGPGIFVLWLRRKGYEDAVRASLAAQGLDLDREANDLYVSPPIGEALLALEPGLGATPDAVLAQLSLQFAPKEDISDEAFISLARDILASRSTDPNPDWSQRRLPATLLVLDEVQQYIGDLGTRSLEVQTVVQNLQNQLGGQVMVVATGQSALQDTSHLQKLIDRFGIRVQLRSNDVDGVVRKVILEKRPDAIPALDQTLGAASGEIHRHLQGTKIAPHAGDDRNLVQDYPLLPVRRRFWEHVLRAVDSSGRGGQLRSQLQLTQEATGKIADAPLGTIIPGDAIFDRLRESMVTTGVLTGEIDEAIQAQQDSGRPDAALRARCLALVFLIAQLPTTGIDPTGLQATAGMIADLLVEDLGANNGKLRDDVRAALEGLADEGRVMVVDGQYRLTTREGQEWDAEFRSRQAGIRADDARIAFDRESEIRAALGQRLKGLSVLQGETKTRRDYALHFGDDAPPQTEKIPIWVRTEWSASEKRVREDAQAAGIDSATIHVLLPRRNADELRGALAAFAAAKETIEVRPQPSTDEGRHALAGMRSRMDGARARLDGLITEILDHARVYHGGGTEALGNTLPEMLQGAMTASASRLFPHFGAADRKGWDKVVKLAQEGNGDPLKPIGHQGEVLSHPVVNEVYGQLLTARSGSQIRKVFTEPPYGWPQDAIDGALLALTVAEQVKATQGGRQRLVRELTHMQIGPTEFSRVAVVPTVQQRLAMRKLVSETVGNVTGEDGEKARRFVTDLSALAQAAGGPAPMPEAPQPHLLADLKLLQGGELVIALADNHETLRGWWRDWQEAGKKRSPREARWQRLQRLLEVAKGLPEIAQIQQHVDGIRQHRLLLQDPDPLDAPLDGLANGLRNAIRTRWEQYDATRDEAIAGLEASPEWTQLTNPQWKQILARHGLGAMTAPQMGDDAEILRELEQRPLETWQFRIAALPASASKALAEAVQLLKPQAVSYVPKAATLETPEQVEQYLEDLRSEITKLVEAGHPVMITR